MKTEMDLLQFDERQRLAWLLANRGTVIAVGVTWIGLIVRELVQGRVPLFMIAMVPVFALLRVGLFFYYCSTSGDVAAPRRGGGVGRVVKILATMLLLLAVFFPLYRYQGSPGPDGTAEGARNLYAWNVVQDDWGFAIPLAFAFLWPMPIQFLSRRSSAKRLSLLAQWAEPLLAALSVLVILVVPQILFEFRRLFWVLFLMDTARPQIGCYLVVAANGLYLVGWLSTVLRPWTLQPNDAA